MVILGLLVGVLIGVATSFVVLRRRSASEAMRAHELAGLSELLSQQIAEQAADLEAGMAVERERMVQAVMLQLSTDREAATQATIDTVLAVAGDKLGSHTAAASSELGLRSEAIDQKMRGMNDELRRVGDLVTTLQKDKVEQHAQLIGGIDEAVRASAALTQTTQALREALSNSRARGQWGERMAEDVLRSAGFVEGVNYLRQQTLAGGGRPDLTFLLPRERLLHMDVKFPIDNYLRYLEAPTDRERGECTKAFLKDVRLRIKELTQRDYHDPETTVGYVLLFIPNESVYGFIHDQDRGLLDHALGRQVVMCSPFTLFAVLGVVRQSVDNFLLERTSDEILECLNGFTKQWASFSEKVDQLGKQLTTAHKTYDDLASTRRRQLQKQLDKVDRLRSARSLDELDELTDEPVGPVGPGEPGELLELAAVDARGDDGELPLRLAK